MSRPLPQPQRERWQPLRAGLVDIFYYDHEEFHFRDGRLLLRGNNGTGKSKVLALTLPFLLDAELSPHRVEPDAEPKKRMEWNLLLGGEHSRDERVGYTWLELGRRDADGQALYCTLGCGLRAVSGRGITKHWFFLSNQRVGEDLALVDGGVGGALGPERLEDAIGAHGAVYGTASAYRRAVDETLFGLGEQRYGALIDLLIKIRAPQLSKRPSERALSDALTGALSPLDQALIADVAEAFRGLEEDRGALTAMLEAREAAERYLSTYRDYARIACRRRAAPPRRAQSEFDRVSRDLAAAQEAHAKAGAEREQAQAALLELQDEEKRLRVQDRTLREGPEARSARELENAAEQARLAAGRAREARGELQRRADAQRRGQRRLAEAGERADDAGRRLAQARGGACEQAGDAGIGTAFAEQVDGPIGAAISVQADAGLAGDGASAGGQDGEAHGEALPGEDRGATPDAPAAADLARAHESQAAQIRDRAGTLLDSQQRAIEHLRKLLGVLEQRDATLIGARRRHDECSSEAADLAQRRADASRAMEQAATDLTRAAGAYVEGARRLSLSDPAEVIAKLELWTHSLDGASPLQAAVLAAARAAGDALARAEADLDARQGGERRLLDDLDAKIEEIRAGAQEPPPAPHTREAAARQGRPGAPLWQLVDFRDEVTEDRRAGLEAALEAAGILDAWVSPDGKLLSPGAQDVLLAPEALDAPGGASAACLADVLRAAIDPDDPQASSVAPEAVERILATVGLGAEQGATWVSHAGEFRIGVLRGAWRKPAAAFIGQGAREAARRARLAELEQSREQVRGRLAEMDAERAALAEHRTELEQEIASMPADEALRDAHTVLAGLDAEHGRLAGRVDAAARALAQAEQKRAQAEQTLRESAAELGLPAERERLDQISRALQGLRVALAELFSAYREQMGAHAAAAEAAAELRATEHDLREQEGRRQGAEREAAESGERHKTLQETVGAAVAEMQSKLAAVAVGLRENETARGEADERRTSALRAEGDAHGRLSTLGTDLHQVTERRRAAVDSLRRFAATGLIAVALGGEVELPGEDESEAEGEWSVRAALRVARAIEQALADVADDDGAWQRAQRRVTDEHGLLADALRRHGNNASARMEEEGIVVEVVFRGRASTVPELASALAEEVADRERLLDEREREILENHLVSEVASSLQELISDAEHRVDDANRELADRPTSTGMRLKLSWRVLDDGPPGLAEARSRLLRQTSDAWSPEDRAAVGAFLHSQIQDVRSRDLGGPWIEHLTEALDYRSWHRFTIERHQGGRWRSATGPASGGERVLIASMPLFAAASSYYASAGNPCAPRMVMLDEAFAGVDDDARAKCLGLLAAFDLDVVMTSEREWGCYPEVPGLAIAQLARVQDIPAVLVSHWEWDGATRTAVERPQPSSSTTVAAGNGAASADGDGLWESAGGDG